MPVRDAAPYLDASISSILQQTFTDFEFVVLDDASTDGSSAVLRAWASRDARMRVHRSERPSGLVGSSNAVVAHSAAPLVARMDADDVSHPDRLARQVAVLDAHPDAVLVASLFEGIDARGRVVRSRDRWRLIRRSPFAPFSHGSVMFRRAAFDAVGGYHAFAEYWEDLDLFRRLATQGRLLVLPDALYRYRFHAANSRLSSKREVLERASVRMRRAIGDVRAEATHETEDARSGPIDDPSVLYSIAAPGLWAGHPPELWSRLRLRSLWPPRPTVAAIFAVALTGAVSPGATRAGMGLLIAGRDRLAGLRVGREPWEWRFES